MKTQQSNFRLSAQAQSNLKIICDVSGVNQTAAVEMALAALANGLTNRRNAMTKIEITIQHDYDGFYGADENHEQPDVEQRYCDMVSAAILKLYPDAKISHEWGQYYSAKVIVHVDDNWDDDDKQNSDIRETVEQIEENIYGRDGSFWHNSTQPTPREPDKN